MKKSLSRYFFLLILCCLATIVLAGQPTIHAKAPILTPIKGLTINSHPGYISLVNNTGKDIPVSKMLLMFNLDQENVASLWGNPWLNWMKAPQTQLKTAKLYSFINQVNLPNSMLRNGDTITVNYSPEPWNNPNAATDVQLFNLVYPLNPAPITTTVTYQGGVYTLTLKNTVSKAFSLDGAQLRMDYNGQIYSSIWGTPWANWTVTQGKPNYVLNAGASPQIPADGTMTISFNGTSEPITNLQLWIQEDIAPLKSSININFPATPVGVTSNPQITLKGPSYPNGKSIIGTWGQSIVEKDLQTGTYTLSAPDITTTTATYLPTITPNPVLLSSSDPINVNLSYTLKEVGKLQIKMGTEPQLGVTAPIITITGPEFTSGINMTSRWNSEFFVCPGGELSCSGIKTGEYLIKAPKIYSNTDAFIPKNFVNPVLVSSGNITTVELNYEATPQGSFITHIILPSVKKLSVKENEFIIKFVNQEGQPFSKTLITGDNTVSLPVGDTYTITAPLVADMSATVNPSAITVNPTATADVTIQYRKGAAQKFVVYYGGWFGMQYNLNNLPTNVTCLNLSFANITSSYQVDTVPSGSLTNIPAPNVRMQPSYINWTNFKYNRPFTKVLLAVGGATYSAIWNNVLTPTSADTIAKNIAEAVNRGYPVYRGEFSNQADFLGNVTMDGVDLDIETGGRLSAQVSQNVILLTQSLKKYLNPGKIITFAGFSVGADPNDSRCTVPGSVHCGEDIPLLQNLGSTFEWVNVMAYDAGQDYATSKYQIALANYASYIGKGKTLLGLDIQNQWPGFSETAAQLATKASWQKQNGYGGAMFWGVSVENNPTKEQQYVTAIAEAIK